MKQIISSLYLPFFLLGGNGLAIVLVERDASKIWLVVLALGLIALSFYMERLLPYDKAFNRTQSDSARDTCHAIVNESLSILGWLILPLMGGLFTIAPIWPAHWSLVSQLILAILIADIGITLAHYASHQISMLWRLHAVHHSVTRMYGLNGLMKHPMHQLIETFAGVFPLLLMGVSQQVLALLIVAVVIQLLLQHSNVHYACGPFRHVWAVNRVHRFHHLRSAKEGNVNFGLFTTLTDRLLGTAYFDPERKVGVADLGIEAAPDYPQSYVQQLCYPFLGKRD